MNLPNKLSAFRLALVPVFAIVFFSQMKNAYLYAMIIFVLAAATDILDGYIARKYDLITPLGRILDPLADKLMMLTALTCTAIKGIIPVWVLIIYFLKELTMLLGGFFLYKRMHDVPSSNKIGKAATVVFVTLVACSMLMENIGVAVPYGIKAAIFGAALALAVTALVVYTTIGYRFGKNKEKK